MPPAPISKISPNDKGKLDEFFGTYSEKIVADLIKRLAYGASYRAELNPFFVEHAAPVATPPAVFSDPRLERSRSAFAAALRELSVFVSKYFAIPDFGSKSYYLLPKINEKFCGHPQTKEEYLTWIESKRNLDALVEKVEAPYSDLLFVVKMLKSPPTTRP